MVRELFVFATVMLQIIQKTRWHLSDNFVGLDAQNRKRGLRQARGRCRKGSQNEGEVKRRQRPHLINRLGFGHGIGESKLELSLRPKFWTFNRQLGACVDRPFLLV